MSSHRLRSLAPAGALALLLTACTVGTDYRSPAPRAGEGWSAPDLAPEPAPEASPPGELDRWWERFGDPTLDRLVETALAQSLDLRQTAARVAEARAARDHVTGRRRPAVAAGGSVTERRQSENGVLPIDRIPGLERDQTIFDAGFDASWELDLFGGTRRALEAAEARLESRRLLHQAARLSLAAEVARTYLALRGGQRRLAAIESALAALRRTEDLVELRVEAGESAAVERSRVEADRRSLAATLPGLRAELRGSALALGALTGALPESELELLAEAPPALALAPFPVGERAAILRRRPDVQAAERQLAAAVADIGVATAELYPRLAIGASGGFQSLAADELLRSSSTTWAIVPGLSWRIFDGGRVRAEIRIAEARAEAAAAAWEGAVLAALGDAERALARYRGGLEAIEVQRAAVAAAGRTRDIERLRHEAGETSLLELLAAERRLDDRRATLAAYEVAAASDLVALIKALGGGWS